SSFLHLAEDNPASESGPYVSLILDRLLAIKSIASSQLLSTNSPSFLIRGFLSLSGFLIISLCNLPLTHKDVPLTGEFSFGVTPTTFPSTTFKSKLHPTPQKGHVVVTFSTSQGLVPLSCLFVKAPVGHTDTHCPHNLQFSVLNGSSYAVVTVELNPLPTKS